MILAIISLTLNAIEKELKQLLHKNKINGHS